MGDGEVELGAVDGTAVVGVSASGGPMIVEDRCFLENIDSTSRLVLCSSLRIHRASWREEPLVSLHGLAGIYCIGIDCVVVNNSVLLLW